VQGGPRSGVDPATGTADRDRQGTATDEKSWLRSWTDELYLWYREVPSSDPAAYSTALAYFGVLNFPWIIKPVFGLISDFVPLFGYRRTSSLLLASGGLVAVVYGCAQAATRGPSDPLVLELLATGIVALGAFAAREARTTTPLLPLSLLLDRQRAAAYLSAMLAIAGMFGAFLFFTYELQVVLGFTPLQAGLAFVPMTLASLIAGTQLAGGLALIEPERGTLFAFNAAPDTVAPDQGGLALPLVCQNQLVQGVRIMRVEACDILATGGFFEPVCGAHSGYWLASVDLRLFFIFCKPNLLLAAFRFADVIRFIVPGERCYGGGGLA